MLSVYFAQKAFVMCDGCLLAVRRCADDLHHPMLWEVPGGRLEAGENLDEQLAREVREEAGIAIVPGEPFYVWKWNIKAKADGTPDTIVAVARLCSALTSTLDDSGRVADDGLDLMEWIPLTKLHDYSWIPNMLPVLEAFIVRTCSAAKPAN